MSKEKIGYKDVLKQREYMKVVLAALINRFGDSIDAIASSWIVYELTGNAVWSAIIFAVNKLPTVVITPLAGAWVEGRKKKTIMIVTDIIRAICVAVVATGYLMGFLQAWILVITTFIISTVEAFRNPANTALTPRILDKEYYSYGMSLMSTASSVVELIGMAMAAGIIAAIGVAGAIYIDMITFILSAFIMLFVNTKEQDLTKIKFDKAEYFTVLKEGFSYVRNIPIIFFIVMVCIFLNGILVPLNSLEAPLANEILMGGAEVLSILGIAVTLGMLLGTVIFPKIEERMNGKIILFIPAMMLAVFYIGLPACQPLYDDKMFMYIYVALITAALGVSTAIANMYINVIFVKQVEPNYMARVGSILSALASAAVPVVSFIVSGLAGVVSTKVIFILSGILALLMGIYILTTKVFEAKQTLGVAEGLGESA